MEDDRASLHRNLYRFLNSSTYMCGIFGYVGDRPAADAVIEGLRRLDYRGYDSWGVAALNGSIVRDEGYARSLSEDEKRT